ncbi:MAG: TP53 regulating kinase-like protein [Candidatus Woesearchaeota archaeon]|jgi:TP53 regulating kinase-like protein
MNKIIYQGAESTIEVTKANTILKKRFPKTYRHKELDMQFNKYRTRAEAKILQRLQDNKIGAPELIEVNEKTFTIEMEYIQGGMLKNVLTKANTTPLAKKLAQIIAKLHNANIIHADLTTSNILVREDTIFLIDFGLSYVSKKVEDKAVDIHLLNQATASSHHKIHAEFMKQFLKTYFAKVEETEIIKKRLEVVQSRGRNKQ